MNTRSIPFYNGNQVVSPYEVKQKQGKKFPCGSLMREENRCAVIRLFTDGFKRQHGAYPHKKDFENAGLRSMLHTYYGASPFRAFENAGFTDPTRPSCDSRLIYEPWAVMEKLPNGFWNKPENRTYAIRWLVKKTQAERGGYPTTRDFKKNHLHGLLGKCNSSPLEALEEAGYTDPASPFFDPVLDFAPWIVLPHMPHGYWTDDYNRASATRWVVAMSRRRPKNIKAADFTGYHLWGLIEGRSVHSMLEEAGFKVKAQDMRRVPPNHWRSRKNRVEALRDFAEGKDVRIIRYRDLYKAGLSRVLYYYKGMGEAFEDAGLK